MWDRVTLKQRAKDVLRYSYAPSLGVSAISYFLPVVILFVLCMIVGAISSINYRIMGAGMGFIFFAAILAIEFLWMALLVGKNLFYINAAKGDTQINNVFLPFTSQKFLKISGTMFLLGLRIFLWSLLFYIPGIIKAYQYRMVPYIIAENPDMDLSQAIEISTAMTANDKFNIFILDCSFLGWLMLSYILPGIGAFLLIPYMEATYIQLYEALKYKIGLSGATYPPQQNQNPVF